MFFLRAIMINSDSARLLLSKIDASSSKHTINLELLLSHAQWFGPWHNYYFFHYFFVLYFNFNLSDDVWRFWGFFFRIKWGKLVHGEDFFIKSWFFPFYVLFWAFSVLNTESWQCLTILEISRPLVSYEIGVDRRKHAEQIMCQ
jgi:hypothetical protein